MKKTSIYLSLALAAGLWSCTSEDIPNNVVEEEGKDVYATLSFDFGRSMGTRSQTTDPADGNEKDPAASNTGVEIGQASENNVETIVIVLATKDTEGKFVRITDSGICNASEVVNTTPGAAGVPNPMYKVKFSSKELFDYAGKDVYAFAYCNPTVSFVRAIENGTWNEDMQEEIINPDNSYVWSPNHFLITSAELHPVTIPTIDEFNTEYTGIKKPFDMGKILVQRAAVRFDFASTTISDGTESGNYGENTYPIYDYVGDDDETPNGSIQGFVTIDGLALFNEAKQFYLLERTASNIGSGQEAKASPTTQLLYPERSNNWVISPAEKTFFYSINGSLATGTTNPPATPESFIYTSISTIMGNPEDDNQNWNTPETYPAYHIWRYATENTIPSVAGQIHGISTGVLFRGYISGAEGSDLANDIAAKNPIYSFQGKMYGNLARLKAYVLAYPGSALSVAFQSDFNVSFDESNTKEEIAKKLEGVEDLTASTKYFDVYKSDAAGHYYVYYYYYNRHNDNLNNVVMGPMEFATVRNNVYKLKLTNIYQWGNPGDKPTDPDDPDEEPELFCRVQVEVLPWVVKINNIEF